MQNGEMAPLLDMVNVNEYADVTAITHFVAAQSEAFHAFVFLFLVIPNKIS